MRRPIAFPWPLNRFFAQKPNKNPLTNHYHRGLMIHPWSQHFRSHPEGFCGRGIWTISPLPAMNLLLGWGRSETLMETPNQAVAQCQYISTGDGGADATCLTPLADLLQQHRFTDESGNRGPGRLRAGMSLNHWHLNFRSNPLSPQPSRAYGAWLRPSHWWSGPPGIISSLAFRFLIVCYVAGALRGS